MNYKSLAILFISLLFISCDKSIEVDPLGAKTNPDIVVIPACQVTGVTLHNEDNKLLGSVAYEYHTEGKLAKAVSTQDSCFLSFGSVVYATDKVIIKAKYNGDRTYTLDSKGNTSKIQGYFGELENILAYNGDGYATDVISRYGVSTFTSKLTYTGGNLSFIDAVYSNGGSRHEISLKYNNDNAVEIIPIANPLYFAELHEPLPGFMGKTSKNRLSEVVNKYYFNNMLQSDDTYTYTYLNDIDGKVIKIEVANMTRNYNNGIPTPVRSYKFVYTLTYSCK
jgi:hypothetical protein